MAANFLRKKRTRITLVITGVVLLLGTGFHFWFIHYTRTLLEDMVEKKSNGKLKLEIGHLGYNYFSRKMTIRDAEFYSTDSVHVNTAYLFRTEKITIRLHALLPFITGKKLYIDTLHLAAPEIRVTRLHDNGDPQPEKNNEVSVPYEMGKIYKSIQGALQELQVRKFRIEEDGLPSTIRQTPGRPR